MIYFNSAIRETLFAESDGVWNQATVEHPKLSLSERFQEKEWFDRQKIFWLFASMLMNHTIHVYNIGWNKLIDANRKRSSLRKTKRTTTPLY